MIVTNRSEIPDAPFYVLCNDRFMSGWGHAEGKINTIIFPCESLDQAEIVERNALNRSDQQRVRIVENKPRLQASVCYSLHGPDDYSRWYKPRGF